MEVSSETGMAFVLEGQGKLVVKVFFLLGGNRK